MRGRDRRLRGYLLCVLAAVWLVGCASASTSSGSAQPQSSAATQSYIAPSSRSPATHFSESEFKLNTGLALGTFDRWIYRPIQAGVLKRSRSHAQTLTEAGLASLYVGQQLRLAAAQVRRSRILSALYAPLTELAARVAAIRTPLTSGTVSNQAITGLSVDLQQIASIASARGVAIPLQHPSAAQLTAALS